jgi:HEAT repeat protein
MRARLLAVALLLAVPACEAEAPPWYNEDGASPNGVADALEGDDPRWRRLALSEVGHTPRFREKDPEGRVAAALLRILETEDDAGLREGAMRALGRLGEARAIPHLVEGLEHPSPRVRRAAADALRTIGTPAEEASREALARACEDPDPDVRRAALRARDAIETDLDLELAYGRAGSGRSLDPEQDEVVRVHLTRDGRAVVKKKALERGELARYLLLRADTSRQTERPHWSNVGVTVHPDRETPGSRRASSCAPAPTPRSGSATSRSAISAGEAEASRSSSGRTSSPKVICSGTDPASGGPRRFRRSLAPPRSSSSTRSRTRST